ncbi:MAG TPA: GLUG motif-containing protein [Candidatus Hydrogenedens sp.]|nr:GLUG motif-containing protein [Candidatus Hydrogenedens sp.]
MNNRDCYGKPIYFFLFLFCCVIFLSGSSSWATPIQISSIEELQKIGNDANYPLNGVYELTEDIDASATSNWNEKAGFKPIGTFNNPFAGDFNGKGYKIKGLVISRADEDDIGLFGYVDAGGKVHNLRLENVSIKGNSNVGGIVGRNEGVVTQSCVNSGTIKGADYVGGLTGQNVGTVSQCYNLATITGNNRVGGLIGENLASVSNSYNSSSVTGKDYVGGLIGYNNSQGNNVTNCYSRGTVRTTAASTEERITGGLIAKKESGNINNCYWDINASGQSTSDGGTGKTTEEMKQKGTFINWDFETVWRIYSSDVYPYPYPFLRDISPGSIIVDSVGELQKIGKIYPLNGEFELIKDIDMSGIDLPPIGTNKDNPFKGKFDGKGYKIIGLTINRTSENYVGLFGYVDTKGEIKNLNIENASVSGSSFVGILAGQSYGTVSNCYTEGSVSGYTSASSSTSSSIGVLIGQNHGTVSSCRAKGSISGSTNISSIGILAGQNYGTISSCHAEGSVSGYASIGGAVGSNSGKISSCYAEVTTQGSINVGGLVGENNNEISNCYATGSVSGILYSGGLVGGNYRGTINYCYSAGPVSKTSGASYIGGLLGYNHLGTVSNSYWDTETSKQSSSAGGTGKTTAKMKQRATFAGWDFEKVWYIKENESYPQLISQFVGLNVVPDVVGMNQNSAQTVIKSANLTVGDVIQECSNDTSSGNVISQNPPAGTQVDPGSVVTIKVSTGACPMTLKELKNIIKKRFSLLDANGDNLISWDELSIVYPWLTREIFSQIDTNGDGNISQDEATTKNACGCTSKSFGNDSLWRHLFDFIFIGILLFMMNGSRLNK